MMGDNTLYVIVQHKVYYMVVLQVIMDQQIF
jgi:hypothetical protein